MDKDRFAAAPSSWLEMNNFIGDLMAFSASGSSQLLKCPNNQSLRAAWESVGPETPASKSCYPTQSDAPSQSQRKNMAGISSQSGQRIEGCNEQQLRPYACRCPGCPLSSASTSASTMHALCLKPRDSSSSQAETSKVSISQSKELSTVALGLGSCLSLALSLEERNGEPTSLSNPEHQEKGTNTHSPTPASSSNPQICAAPLQAFPCFCCHPCPHLLHPAQQASETHFAHTHSHHHYHHHHHHCPLTACLLCQRSLNCAQQEGHAQRQHPCMHCSALFMRPSQLLQHQRTQHSSKAGGFLCPECGRVFNSHSNLRVHLNVHTGARPYTCADCGKSFSQSGALKIHRRVHTGERPYTCTYCGRGFPHLAGVRAHQRIHTGEKPYQCMQCGKGFTQSGALKVHMRVHTGERPFICSLCGKGFSNRSGVRFHQRTAHGIITEPNSVGRPSLANSDVQQKQADQPMEHRPLPSRKISEGEEVRRSLPYSCEDCGMRFQDALSRNKHQALEHYPAEEDEQSETHRTAQGDLGAKKTLG
ncbi:zinc finger protein 135 [Neoarius graeffei]|uniref:zinc finger protein 135 n=1 Tax=Neoarius graeffei TaxID=443677 RepID=UPI00298C0EE5|nr:zinc finger protein 135 [Neoarius graeffei]